MQHGKLSSLELTMPLAADQLMSAMLNVSLQHSVSFLGYLYFLEDSCVYHLYLPQVLSM